MKFFLIFSLLIFIAWFYRYPNKTLMSCDNRVYSPAFGRIMDISPLDSNRLHIAIFLSPLDIHYQFFPVCGTITKIVKDSTGKFELANDLNKSRDNEKVITSISTKWGILDVYQIAGKLVRRIKNKNTAGNWVRAGDDIGMIQFGSRVDIIIPNRNKFDIKVKKGDYVNGTLTILGEYSNE